jgi:cobalt-zinc-cadmium efflux system protein
VDSAARPAVEEPSAGPDVGYLTTALVLIGVFMIGEVVAALFAHSLVLLADAGHMLTDVGALGASLWAMRLAARPAHGVWTYGLRRAEILSAAGNGVTLAAVGLLIVIGAVRRLIFPPQVGGGIVLAVAVAGIAVNLAATLVLARASRESLNVRGASMHILTDLYAFAGTALAGVVILVTGWQRADAVAALVVAALMGRSAWALLRDSGRVLLEAAPDGVDLGRLRAHLVEVDHVLDVHDLHAWTVTSGLPTVSAHVVVDEACFVTGHAAQLLDALQNCLSGHFDVAHATFQLEPATHAAHETGGHP